MLSQFQQGPALLCWLFSEERIFNPSSFKKFRNFLWLLFDSNRKRFPSNEIMLIGLKMSVLQTQSSGNLINSKITKGPKSHKYHLIICQITAVLLGMFKVTGAAMYDYISSSHELQLDCSKSLLRKVRQILEPHYTTILTKQMNHKVGRKYEDIGVEKR